MSDESRKGKPRVVEPQRRQGVIRFEMPEDKLAPTHTARVLWDVIGALDLTAFLDGVKAIEGTVGRKTLSPQMKLTLWLYAISNGVGSAREIARLIASDDGYRWIVGDLEVGHHTLSAFRVNHGAALEQLMTDLLASRMHKGVLSLELVAQDGIRIRAAATAPSFRRLESLLECREQAALHLKATLANADDPELTHGQRAAREAGARDFQRRVEEAISMVTELQKTRRPSEKEARVSTTDAEARVMKMADGGFRPAYNVCMATAGSPLGGPRTIVGVQVTNVGSDMGMITPMLAEIERRTGQLPKTLLADANHADAEGPRRGRRWAQRRTATSTSTTTVKVKAHVDVNPARARTSGQASKTLCPTRLELLILYWFGVNVTVLGEGYRNRSLGKVGSC